MLKYYSTRSGKNLVLVLNQPMAVGIHWIPEDATIEPWAQGVTYCPRALPQGHPKHRDACYLCFMADHDKRFYRDMHVSYRTMWPVYDLSVMIPDELGLLWLMAGFRLNVEIAREIGGLLRKPLAVWKTGVGMRTDYHVNTGTVVGGTVMPLHYPVRPEPDIIIWSEERLARLFADPYTLDYPRQLLEASNVAAEEDGEWLKQYAPNTSNPRYLS